MLLALWLGVSSPAYGQVTILESDSLALVDLYESTNGPGWNRKNNWLDGSSHAESWEGVGSDNEDRVSALFLANNNLVGPLPASLGDLAHPNALYFSGNTITGIPEELGNLQSLKRLELDATGLTSIPEALGQLANLEALWIGYNELNNLPDLSGLGSLESLVVAGNRLDFDDLEPLAGWEADPSVRVTYIPQDSIDTVVLRENGEVRLAARAGGTQSTCTWYRDGRRIDGATDLLYTLPDPEDRGVYWCHARNELLPNLVLFSRPVQPNEPGIVVVNSEGDAPLKADAEAGVCDTGGIVVRIGLEIEEPECTLRAAIETVNRAGGKERLRIQFDVPDVAFATIRPETPLPPIDQPVVIDGATQPGAGSVRLDGSMAGKETSGLNLFAENTAIRGMLIEGFEGDGVDLLSNSTVTDCIVVNNGKNAVATHGRNNTIRNNVLSGNERSGVYIDWGSSGNRIENNIIGLEADGLTALPNKGSGVFILDGASVIQNNHISANEVGVLIHSLELGRPSGNRIEGNTILGNLLAGVLIGKVSTDRKRPNDNRILNNLIAENGTGIDIRSGNGNWIENNRIAENKGAGILVRGARTSDTSVRNNRIGMLFDETDLMGNGGHGVEVENALNTRIWNNNVIAGNGGSGVFVSGREAHGTSLLDNKIGVDEAGRLPFGNEGHGIYVEDAGPSNVKFNLISANGKSGVFVEGSVISLAHNQIGGDVFGLDPLGVMGNKEDGVELSNIGPEGGYTDLQINAIAFNHGTGLLGSRVARAQIINNIIRRNLERGIDFIDSGDKLTNKVLIKLNRVADQEGLATGIHLTNSHAVIEGNQITGDAGDAITFEQGSTAAVSYNNIFDNQGFGLNNLDASVPITGQDNWWGDASGPGGAGPGAGDPVSAGVDFADWRSEMIAVVAASEQDTLFVPIGAADTASVFLQNWQTPDDVLDLAVNDAQGWLQDASSFSLSLADSLGAEALLAFFIPGGTLDGTPNAVEVIATSQADPTKADTVAFTLIAQSAALAHLIVAPDSIAVAPGDTVHFATLGFDQFGRTVEVAPAWSATGGTIDAMGRYIAGTAEGTFLVTATDPATQIRGEAVVLLGIAVAVEDGQEVPTAFRLEPNYPNPFNPETTIRYTVAEPGRVRLTVYDVLGREVAILVDEMQGVGAHQMVFDAARLSSGVYLYRLVAEGFSATRTMMVLK